MKHRKPISVPGTYARSTGITQAMTGPIASSRSERHGADAQMPNAVQATVNVTAIVNRSVGRIPNAGRS